MFKNILKIKYCGVWNYKPRFELLKQIILSKLNNTKLTEWSIEGYIGEKSSFEVILNDNLIYSKLEIKKHHENYDELADIIIDNAK